VAENNFVFGGANPRGIIGSSGVVSDYNAHDGTWNSASEGPHTLALSTTEALLSVVNAANENFHLVYGTRLIAAAEPQDSFFNDFDGDLRGPLWDIAAYQFAPTATPTPTPTPTATPTTTPAPTATPNSTPFLCSVPNFIGARPRRAARLWEQAGFSPANITITGGRGERITWQSLPAGSLAGCATAMITVGP
jgi:hypothetical protein